MSHDSAKNLKNALQEVHLSPIEKARVRGILASRLSARPHFWSALLRPWVAALVIVILVAGGGTSLAAEQSLPGDTLYSVKVQFNEPIRGWLAQNPEAQANWQAERLARRLEEMNELESKGRLAEATRQDLETRINEHEMRELDQAFEQHVADMNRRFSERQRFLNDVAQAEVENVFKQIESTHRAGLKARGLGEVRQVLQEYQKALNNSRKVFILIDQR